MYFAQHIKINFCSFRHDSKRNGIYNLRHLSTSIVENIIQLVEIVNKHNGHDQPSIDNKTYSMNIKVKL